MPRSKSERSVRKASNEPPPEPGREASGNEAAPSLHYKVVEVSQVDEQALERAVNGAVRDGWTLENVQFAMRESSKRPSMAFVFFTKPGPPPDELAAEPPAYEQGQRLSAWERLEQLAEGGDEP